MDLQQACSVINHDNLQETSQTHCHFKDNQDLFPVTKILLETISVLSFGVLTLLSEGFI